MDFFLEWAAALTGLASVALTARRRIECWPVGLVSVVLYAVFFFRLKLYADSALQVFFFATGVYGWWHWARGGTNHRAAPIRVLKNNQRFLIAAVLCVMVPAIAWLLGKHTDASLPFWDTLAACLSICAQVLLMRKFFDSWFFWIAVDVLSLGIYSFKGAWVTLGLYGILLVLAGGGLVAWKRALARGEMS
jgi:nicotinamide mononucleotide transporter